MDGRICICGEQAVLSILLALKAWAMIMSCSQATNDSRRHHKKLKPAILLLNQLCKWLRIESHGPKQVYWFTRPRHDCYWQAGNKTAFSNIRGNSKTIFEPQSIEIYLFLCAIHILIPITYIHGAAHLSYYVNNPASIAIWLRQRLGQPAWHRLERYHNLPRNRTQAIWSIEGILFRICFWAVWPK